MRFSGSARSRSSGTSFARRCEHGRRAERLLPGSSRPYGVIGDALVELGRYDAAFAAFERMVTLRPSLASYARVAYARELVGDREGAVAAMRLALDTAAGQPEPTAWASVELAKLQLGLGDSRAARAHVRTALRVLPGYPSARVELARIAAVSGKLDAAVGQARRAADAIPTTSSISLLADLLERAGRRAEARGAARDGRRHRPASRGERRPGRSRIGRRPGGQSRPPQGDSRAGTPRTRRAPVDLRRRCARMGARSSRPLRRGCSAREARAATGHRGRAPLLPPRLRGMVRRRPVGDA